MSAMPAMNDDTRWVTSMPNRTLRSWRQAPTRRRSRVVADLAAKLAQLAADLTRPRFHTWCGEIHVPGPCADGVTRPLVTPSQADRQPPTSSSNAKGGLSAVGPDET